MSDLRATLVAIQELHPAVDIEEWFHTMDGSDSRVVWVCGTCEDPEGSGYQQYPCATRRLADEALGHGLPSPTRERNCPECRGTGTLLYAREIMPGRGFYERACKTCEGSGGDDHG